MTSVRRDFTIKEARDVTLEFTVTADEGQVIAGSTIDFWMARHMGSVSPVLMKSGVITGALTFNVEIVSEDSEGMEGKYYYEVQIHTTDGHKVTSTYGYITVEASLIGGSSS